MKTNKYLLITIIFFGMATLCLTFTLAYFLIRVDTPTNDLNIKSGKIDISYEKGQDINGILFNSLNHSSGLNTTIKIKNNDPNKNYYASLYLSVETLPLPLRSAYLKWEVYQNDDLTPLSTGNFADNLPGDEITLLDQFYLNNTYDSYHIYIWLDGDGSTNDMQNQSFSAKIYAKSDRITASSS